VINNGLDGSNSNLLEEERVEWMQKNMKVCPINNTFRLMGKKLTVLILRNMVHLGQTRFNQFLEIEEINTKVLSARLKEMENDGLIKRQKGTKEYRKFERVAE
jgi:DNA-binding HxlR family transcriptional regulator